MNNKTIKPQKPKATRAGGKPTDLPIRIYTTVVTDTSWVPVIALDDPNIRFATDVFLTVDNDGTLRHVAGGEPQISTASKKVLKISADPYKLYPVVFDVPGYAHHANGSTINTLVIRIGTESLPIPVKVRK